MQFLQSILVFAKSQLATSDLTGRELAIIERHHSALHTLSGSEQEEKITLPGWLINDVVCCATILSQPGDVPFQQVAGLK